MSKITLTAEQQTELDKILSVCKEALGKDLTQKQLDEITKVYTSDIEKAQAKAQAEAEANEKARIEMNKKRQETMMPHERQNKFEPVSA